MPTDAPKIRGELMPDPNACTFHVDRPVADEGWTISFQRGRDTQGSALADALFADEEVAALQVQGASVVVWRDGATPWQELAGRIVPVIREVLQRDQPAVSAAAIEAVKGAPTEEIAPLVRRLFDDHINPALAGHGGFARLVKVEDRDVFLEMGGGCQGCAASRLTLRHGIESAIRRVAPQVREVIDVTDHAAGANPYYAS
jgi:Fe-S cluster biogenesis protein NfuA